MTTLEASSVLAQTAHAGNLGLDEALSESAV